MEYFLFPCNSMRITQNYSGGTSHKPHWNGVSNNIIDYPIDHSDGGNSAIYSRVPMKVVRKYGYPNTNDIVLETIDTVATPSGNLRIGMSCTHLNDGEFNNIYVGQTFNKGQVICHEGSRGSYGSTIAAHVHITFFKAPYQGKYLNSNNVYCFVGSGALKPEQACYIDSNINILNNGEISWITKPNNPPSPTPTPSKYPFGTTLKKGTQLYNINGGKYNTTQADRSVTVQGEINGRYEVYGATFDPHIVYVDKNVIDGGTSVNYPFNATVRVGSPLYNEYGTKYKNGAGANRPVTVLGEVNGRYKVNGSTFNPNIVYVDKGSIY